MNPEDILFKAIEQAEKNGYKEHLNYLTFTKKPMVCRVILKMNPLEEIFPPEDIRTWSEEEQREFEMKLGDAVLKANREYELKFSLYRKHSLFTPCYN